MAPALRALLLVSCAAPIEGSEPPPATTGDSTIPISAPAVTLGPVVILTQPGAGLLQSHATVAWGADDRFLVAFVAGTEPATRAAIQLFRDDGTAVGPSVGLNVEGSTADKPDVEWDGLQHYVVSWTDSQGRVLVASFDAAGVATGPSRILYDGELQTDAVDLAVRPDGSGIAIWTEYGPPFESEDDGRIVWRAFDDGRGGDGPPRVADESSRKTSDAAPLPDGGWVAVWARDYDHPTLVDEVVYEVWGRLYRGDGTAWTFRADDLDTAWPSRPAVAVSDGGILAVSWRDKVEAEGAGLGSGAYGRLFGGDATPLGPSIPLGPNHDGDRVVVAWAGELAVFAWQETDPDGLPGVILSVVDGATGEVVVERTAIHEAGGERDERPSIAVRPRDGLWDVVVVWEAIAADGTGAGLRSRMVTIDP